MKLINIAAGFWLAGKIFGLLVLAFVLMLAFVGSN